MIADTFFICKGWAYEYIQRGVHYITLQYNTNAVGSHRTHINTPLIKGDAEVQTSV